MFLISESANMGYLQKKYTEEYFTGMDKNGNKLNYGVEGYSEFLDGRIRDIDMSMLTQISFKNKRVIEFGFGRGEVAKYVIDNGAQSYTGVDFSKAALKIAKKFLKKYGISSPKLYQDDALAFVKKYLKTHNQDRFDIVLMFDFIEHVPRSELNLIMKLLKKILSDKAIIVINTPAYRYDNDVIKDGLNELNNLNSYDASDLREETKGMHCNKYSIVSLQEFMFGLGYINITQIHFFVQFEKKSALQHFSYKRRWRACSKDAYPIAVDYHDDVIDSPYRNENAVEVVKFTRGHLQGVNLILNDNYKNVVFGNGEYDKELFDDFQKSKKDSNIVFDVGGFMGVSGLLFAKLGGKKTRVITFEPNPYNFDRMCLNFSKNNDFDGNIKIFHLALGDSIGDTDFLLSNDIDNGPSSTSRIENTHVEHSRSDLLSMGFTNTKVSIETLDSFITKYKVIPDIIKADIEGAEHLLLMGAYNLLSKHSPILYIELHSQYCALVCTDLLQILGYSATIINEETDRRILVKYMKVQQAQKDALKKFRQKSFEYSRSSLELKNKNLAKEIDKLNKMLGDESRKHEETLQQLLEIKLYMDKLINNPIINTELKLFRTAKKLLKR